MPGYANRQIPYSRGRMLGGSSSVNYMVYTRGASDDFERYAKVTGDSGWGWENIRKYIEKHEKFVSPADGHDTKGEFTPSAHGTNGLLSISLPNFGTVLDDKVIATTKELTSDFPFLEDMNGGEVLGVGWTQSSIGGGARSSSATAYLEPFFNRTNLHVLINAQVTKLVQDKGSDGTPTFHGVEFAAKAGDPVTSVNANKEVILSAGSIGTPTLLQLAGIGDRTDLSKVGIEAIVHNPSVGRNLSDHPLLANAFSVRGNQSFDSLLRSQDMLKASIEQWVQNKTGPLTEGVCNHLGFFRLPGNSSAFKGISDPSSGPKGAHIEMIFSNLWVSPGIPTPENGSFFTITTSVTSPTSRGSSKLSSSDPFAKPIIDPNFLDTNFDKIALRETLKLAKKFVTASSWKDYVIGPFGDFGAATTDSALDKYAAANAATFFHPVGSAAMSAKDASWGVTDPDLKVKGVRNLRVIDASILPYLPSGHTQAPVYLIAERGADLVKADNPAFGSSSGNDSKNSGSKPTSSFATPGLVIGFLIATVLAL